MNNFLDDKTFICNVFSCTQSFTSEEQLTAHKKKHDMMLNVNKGNLYADLTPTPTRFIRNCEEVGLFQDLQNVNPFEETFRKAAEANRNGETPVMERSFLSAPTDDTLHTPNVFPHIQELHREEATQQSKPVPSPPRDASVVEIKEAIPDPIRKYKSVKRGPENTEKEPVIVLLDNRPVTFKLPIPKIAPKVKVFTPKYFSRFSKNVLSSEKEEIVKRKVGRKKASDGDKKKTDEETREINRLAAIRTRKKKKHYLGYLEELNKKLQADNLDLLGKVTALTNENNRLKVTGRPSTVDQSQQTEFGVPERMVVSVREESKELAKNESEKAVLDDHNYLMSCRQADERVKECFYSSIPESATPTCHVTVITPRFPNSNNIPNNCFLRKPFKKRNLNSKQDDQLS